MHIAVLTKPVPDPASGAERLGPDGRLDRANAPAVVNGNDEYALEAGLQLAESAGGEVTVVAMAPAGGSDTLRKALAMGATRGVLIVDPALEGADAPTTARVLAEAVRSLGADLVLAGIDTSDSTMGIVPAAIATHLGLPYLSNAARIEPDPAAGTVRVRRLSARGYDLVEGPLPAVVSCTQALGAPRYPSLKGIMGARSKEIRTLGLAELGVPVPSGWSTRVIDWTPPPPRGPTRVVRGSGADAATAIADFLAERRLI